VLTAQASAIERYEDRVQGQAELLRETFADFRHGRIQPRHQRSGRRCRNTLNKLKAGINQIAIKIAAAGR
jgi:hypothetical protein